MLAEKTIVSDANIRQENYSFLASLFLLEPREEKIDEIEQLLNLILNKKDVVTEYSKQNEVKNITQEFYDLFFIPVSGKYVPPFESALRNYRPMEKKPYGQLYGIDALHVQSCYDAVGFDPWKLKMFGPLKQIRFPDHIGYELAFMAVLCASEHRSRGNKEIVDQWQGLQYEFLADHLGKWIENFSAAVANNTVGFYEKCAKAACKIVLEDLKILEEKFTVSRGGEHE